MKNIGKSFGKLFLALIVAIIFGVGCFFGLKLIGNAKTGVNPSLQNTNYDTITTQELTEEQMSDTVQLFKKFFSATEEEANFAYQLVVNNGGTQTRSVVYARQGFKVSETENGETTYYDFHTNGKYVYDTPTESWGVVDGTLPSDNFLGEVLLAAIPDLELTEDGKAYTLSDFIVRIGVDKFVEVENITVKFSKKKLVYADISATESGATINATYKFFDFGRTEVSLPQM